MSHIEIVNLSRFESDFLPKSGKMVVFFKTGADQETEFFQKMVKLQSKYKNILFICVQCHFHTDILGVSMNDDYMVYFIKESKLHSHFYTRQNSQEFEEKLKIFDKEKNEEGTSGEVDHAVKKKTKSTSGLSLKLPFKRNRRDEGNEKEKKSKPPKEKSGKDKKR